MARIALTSLSSRRLSTGRTCRQPTEAWAYQVPRVPWRANTWVRRSVYSARCLSGTAHRHHDVEAGSAHVGDARLQCRIAHLDDAAELGAALVPAETEVAHQRAETLQPALILVRPGVELDQQDGVGGAAHELLD